MCAIRRRTHHSPVSYSVLPLPLGKPAESPISFLQPVVRDWTATLLSGGSTVAGSLSPIRHRGTILVDRSGGSLKTYGSVLSMTCQRPSHRVRCVRPTDHHASSSALEFVATIPWAGRFDAEGHLYDKEVAGADRDHVVVRYAIGSAGEMIALDTLLLPDLQAPTYTARGRGGSTAVVITSTIPYSPAVLYDIGPEGDVWLVGSGEYSLHRVGFDGDTSLSVDLRVPPPQLAPAERDSIGARPGPG